MTVQTQFVQAMVFGIHEINKRDDILMVFGIHEINKRDDILPTSLWDL